MKMKFTSVSIVFYFLAGTLFLPNGNFAYLEQIPSIYREFCKTYGKTSFPEFLEDQFLEYGSVFIDEEYDEDEPSEKEEKPVPFQKPVNVVFNIFTEDLMVIKIICLQFHSVHNEYYRINNYTAYLQSLFRPPKV